MKPSTKQEDELNAALRNLIKLGLVEVLWDSDKSETVYKLKTNEQQLSAT